MEFLTSGIRRTAGSRARLPFMLPSFSGARLNSSAVGRLLGISRPTAAAYIRSLEDLGLVWRVPHYGGGRRPVLIAWEDPSPRASLLRALGDLFPDCRFYWWKHAQARVVDLVADLGDERIGFCFSSSERPRRRDWLSLGIAIRSRVIDRGFLLHAGDHAFKRYGLPIVALPCALLMQQLGEWLVAWRAPSESWAAAILVNRAADFPNGFP